VTDSCEQPDRPGRAAPEPITVDPPAAPAVAPLPVTLRDVTFLHLPIGGRALRDDRPEPVAEHPTQQLPLVKRVESMKFSSVELRTGLQAGAQQLPPTRQTGRDAHPRTEEQGQLAAAGAVGQRRRRLHQLGAQRPAPLPTTQVLHRSIHRGIRRDEGDVDPVAVHDVVRDVEQAAPRSSPNPPSPIPNTGSTTRGSTRRGSPGTTAATCSRTARTPSSSHGRPAPGGRLTSRNQTVSVARP